MTSRPQQYQEHHQHQEHYQTPINLIQDFENKNLTCYQWPSLLCTDVSNPSIRWIIGSRFIVPTVGLFSKFWMNVMNRSTVYNANILYDTLNRNYQALTSFSSKNVEASSNKTLQRRPVITYCNHTSCMDDPLIWGSLLPFSWLLNSNRQRWTSAAAEICFNSPIYSIFFSLGKTFPVIRGEGIYQPAMNYASRLMRNGQWLHFFPEGKVIPRPENADPSLLKLDISEDSDQQLVNNNSNKPYSLKWGIARLIIEHVLSEGENEDREYSKIKPNKSIMPQIPPEYSNENCNILHEVDILPMYHIGMDEVLPTKKPYIPRMFCRVTFLVRPEGPIRIDRNFLMKLFSNDEGSFSTKSSSSIELSLTEKRVRLMKFLEKELNILAEKTKALHYHQNYHRHEKAINE